MLTKVYRSPARERSGSRYDQVFSAVMSAAHRLLNDDVPADVEILSNIILPLVLPETVSAYDLGTGAGHTGKRHVLTSDQACDLVERAVTKAIHTHDKDWFAIKQAASAATITPLALEDPALAGLSAAQVADRLNVTRRTVFRNKAALRDATSQDRARWARIATMRAKMTKAFSLRKMQRRARAWLALRPTLRRTVPQSPLGVADPEFLKLIEPAEASPPPVYRKLTLREMILWPTPTLAS